VPEASIAQHGGAYSDRNHSSGVAESRHASRPLTKWREKSAETKKRRTGLAVTSLEEAYQYACLENSTVPGSNTLRIQHPIRSIAIIIIHIPKQILLKATGAHSGNCLVVAIGLDNPHISLDKHVRPALRSTGL